MIRLPGLLGHITWLKLQRTDVIWWGRSSSLVQTEEILRGSPQRLKKGGSLTILATALVDTGSRMDDVIYEEFKGTGNQELQLSRTLAERRIYPAIDLDKSVTRREDLLLSDDIRNAIWKLRRKLMTNDLTQDTTEVLNMLRKTKNNDEFYSAN